jgi:hypothetical protein
MSEKSPNLATLCERGPSMEGLESLEKNLELVLGTKARFLAMPYVWNGTIGTRVARWFIFIPNIPIWVNFGGPWNGKCWHVL